jgi:hypothetical protein
MLVLGKTQSGKSYWVYHQVYPKFKKDHYLIFIDPKPSPYIQPITQQGITIPTINLTPSLLHFFSRRVNLRKSQEIILKPHLRYDFENEARALLEHIIQIKAAGIHQGKILIVVDEAHRFGTKHKVLNPLSKIVKEGEAHGISTILITQHATEIADVMILNCEKVALFGYSPILLKYFERKLELELTEDQKQWLKKGQYRGYLYDYVELERIGE